MKLADLFRSPEYVDEDFAISIPKQFPDFNAKHAKIVGSIDSRDVWGSRCWKDKDVFAFRTGEQIDAFIAVDISNVNGPFCLNRVWCSEDQRGKGLITALLGFFTKKMNNKLLISDDEPLTPEGFNWLYKLLKSPHGFNIHDGTNKLLDPEEFKLKWEHAKKTRNPQPMTIVIENFRNEPHFGNIPGTMWESIQYLGDAEID